MGAGAPFPFLSCGEVSISSHFRGPLMSFDMLLAPFFEIFIQVKGNIYRGVRSPVIRLHKSLQLISVSAETNFILCLNFANNKFYF